MVKSSLGHNNKRLFLYQYDLLLRLTEVLSHAGVSNTDIDKI